MAAAMVAGGRYAARSDLRDAFASLDALQVIEDVSGRFLSHRQADALHAAYQHYGPGAPAGLPTSPLILDLACIEFDSELVKLGEKAFRYMDDVIVLGDDIGLGDHLVALVDRHLGKYGLAINEDKTAVYAKSARCVQMAASEVEVRLFPLDWLGHKVGPRELDISDKTTERILRLTEQKQKLALRQFPLAQDGQNYQRIYANA